MKASGVEEEYSTLDGLLEEAITLEEEAKQKKETAKKKASLEEGGAKLMLAA